MLRFLFAWLLALGSGETVQPSEPLSLHQLQDMIRLLEERQRSLHGNTTHAAHTRRLELSSDTGRATCSFDLIGVVLAVARTGTVLYFVQDSCKTQETINQKTACSATILGLFSSIGFIISFLSDSIAMCQETLNIPATCAAVSGNLIAVLGIMGGSISSLENSCRAATLENDQPPAWLEYIKKRRLKEFTRTPSTLPARFQSTSSNHSMSKLPPVPVRSILSEQTLQEVRNKLSAAEFRRVELSQCVFDVLLTSMFFGRGLLDIYNAAMHSPCDETPEDFDGHTLDLTSACLVSVSGMITTFDFVASLIALVVSECPEGANVKALCASDATILVGAVTGLLQTGTSFLLVCGDLDEHVDHIVEDVRSEIAI